MDFVQLLVCVCAWTLPEIQQQAQITNEITARTLTVNETTVFINGSNPEKALAEVVQCRVNYGTTGNSCQWVKTAASMGVFGQFTIYDLRGCRLENDH
jgi:hypothetical protein